MSAQGVLNYPNGVRQIAYILTGSSADSFEITYENVETSESYTQTDIPYSINFRVLTFDSKYNRITVTRGLLSETFDLNVQNRAAILVIHSDGSPFIKIFDSSTDWPGSWLIINTLSETNRWTITSVGTQDISSDSSYLWVNPMTLTLPDRNSVLDWRWEILSENESYQLSYYDAVDDEWKWWWSTVAVVSNRNLRVWVVYDDSGRKLTGRDLNLRSGISTGGTITDFTQWRWQYFEPALPY